MSVTIEAIAEYRDVSRDPFNQTSNLFNEFEPYGVDQSKLDDLELTYMEMAETANLRRQAIVTKMMITANIDNLIQGIDTVLKEQLDRLIVSLKANERDLVFKYEGARTIIDSPTTRRKLNLDDMTDKGENGELPGNKDDRSPPCDDPIST